MENQKYCSSRIPDGWKLVPIEPTKDLLLAARRATLCNIRESEIKNIYKAMLSASPLPPKE